MNILPLDRYTCIIYRISMATASSPRPRDSNYPVRKTITFSHEEAERYHRAAQKCGTSFAAIVREGAKKGHQQAVKARLKRMARHEHS